VRFDRAAALDRLAGEEFDVVVVGGGITGAGCALDAASRGLRTALVERGDFAIGTSSRSSKLVHGGIRYLEQKEFGLVREALAERQIALRNAPAFISSAMRWRPINAVGKSISTSTWKLECGISVPQQSPSSTRMGFRTLINLRGWPNSRMPV